MQSYAVKSFSHAMASFFTFWVDVKSVSRVIQAGFCAGVKGFLLL